MGILWPSGGQRRLREAVFMANENLLFGKQKVAQIEFS